LKKGKVEVKPKGSHKNVPPDGVKTIFCLLGKKEEEKKRKGKSSNVPLHALCTKYQT